MIKFILMVLQMKITITEKQHIKIKGNKSTFGEKL